MTPDANGTGDNSLDIISKTPEGFPKGIKVVFVVGPPGAGKGTLCKHAAKTLGFYHLSVGDHLRDLANNPQAHPVEAYAGTTPNQLTDIMKPFLFVPEDSMVEILCFKLKREFDAGCHRFLVDGFPRTLSSAKIYEEAVGMPSMVLEVVCPRNLAEARFLNRGREKEDTPEKYDRRYKQFEDGTPSIVKWYSGIHEEAYNEGDLDEACEAMTNILCEL